MAEFNLLESAPKIFRDVTNRKFNKKNAVSIAKEFGREYFDGDRNYGYGGYRYDGRWVPVAKKIISKYNLSNGSKVLDIGCAKGFLLQDLKNTNSRMCTAHLYNISDMTFIVSLPHTKLHF